MSEPDFTATKSTGQMNDEMLSSLHTPTWRWYGLALFLAAVVAWVIEPIGMALGAAIFHLFGKILLRSFKNKFDATFTATMYATLPVILLYWLSPMPIVGAIALLISALWELLTLVLALSRQQGVSVLKSAGVILLSIIAVVAVAIIL